MKENPAGNQQFQGKHMVTQAMLEENQLKVLDSLPTLEIELLGRKEPRAKIGERISVKVEGLPLPGLDYMTGKLTEGRFIQNMPVLAEIDTVFGKQRIPCVLEEDVLTFSIPEGAVDSMVNFQIPVEETNAKACSLDTDIKKLELDAGEYYVKDLRHSYMVYRGFLLTIRCDSCKTVPICPYGAIKFDAEDNCYVDKSICRGQTRVISGYRYTPDGRRINDVASESTCFSCFMGDESLSSRCLHRKVSRVMDSSTCACGSCSESMQVVPGVCLRELCEYDAITGGNPASTRCGNQTSMDDLGGIYSVDYDKCVGCYECYDNIICDRVVMKAHIKKRLRAAFNIVGVDYVKPTPPVVETLKPFFTDEKVYLKLWGRGRSGLIEKTLEYSLAYPRTIKPVSPLLSPDLEIVDRLFVTASLTPSLHTGFPMVRKRPVAETKVIDLNRMARSPFLVTTLSLKFFRLIELEYSISGLSYI